MACVKAKLGLPDAPARAGSAGSCGSGGSGGGGCGGWPAGAGHKWVTLRVPPSGRVVIAGAADWEEVPAPAPRSPPYYRRERAM